jgi:hypothetical protein
MGTAASERYLDVPFAPGESPFHAKGIQYVDAIAFYNEHVPGGWEGLTASIGEPKLKAYLSQRFLAGAWYDVFPFVAAHRAASIASGQPYLDFIRRVAGFTIGKQFRGIYRVFLKIGRPDAVVRSLPDIAAKYYNFLRVDVKQIGPNHYETRAGGLPTVVAPSYQVSSEVAVITALEIAGARNIRHRWMPAEQDGEAHGLPLVRVRREIRWESGRIVKE